MKKAVSFVIAAIISASVSVLVLGGSQIPLDGTPYFYEKKDTVSTYTLYDSSGNIISENEYDVIKSGGGKIIARLLAYDQRYGILDTDLNIILEPRFSQINYNENTKTFECLTWGAGPDKIEFFDSNMDPVPQPEDIRHLDGTDCYYERVIDEAAEISGGYISYYICDADGSRLSDTQYKAVRAVAGQIELTDMNGVVNTYADTSQFVNRSSASAWARDSINTAVSMGLVPDELQGAYTENINRGEFCRLALQTYISRTGYSVDAGAESPFADVSDEYVTAAYSLGIVSGTGGNRFSPGNSITRQEAAVMLDNIAKLLELKADGGRERFVDEAYFAGWAKDAIYDITSIKSGGTYIMTGTEANKFSPWMNYTREQAIATMLRLYSCKQAPSVSDGQYKQPVGGDWLYCEDSKYITSGNIAYKILRVRKDGSDMQVLLESNYRNSAVINFVADDLIYYNVDGRCYKMGLDGSGKTEISVNEMNYAESLITKEVYDGDNKYFLKAYPGGTGMKSPDYCLTESDRSGGNEVRLYDKYMYCGPVLYGGYIFASGYTDDSLDPAVLRFDKNGNIANITKDTGKSAIEIIKAEDNRIYYRTGYHGGNIYSVNIDGSDSRLVYSLADQ